MDLEVFGEQFRRKSHKYFRYELRQLDVDPFGWQVVLDVLLVFDGKTPEVINLTQQIVADVYQDMDYFSATHYYCAFEVNISGGKALTIECIIKGGMLP